MWKGFGDLSGKSVDEVNPIIFDLLKASGVYYKLEDYSHRYPVCWRCNSELVFRLVDEWFISMDELRHTMMDATRTIKWVPAFGEARELDWLRNMQDWMISKKRYYGLALPIYECDGCGNVDVIGSREELKDRTIAGWDEFDGNSPHRPWIDAIEASVLEVRCCDTAHQRRWQCLVGCWNCQLLHYRLQRRPRVLAGLVPGGLDLGVVPWSVQELVLFADLYGGRA